MIDDSGLRNENGVVVQFPYHHLEDATADGDQLEDKEEVSSEDEAEEVDKGRIKRLRESWRGIDAIMANLSIGNLGIDEFTPEGQMDDDREYQSNLISSDSESVVMIERRQEALKEARKKGWL